MRFFKRRGKEKQDDEHDEISFDLWFQERMDAVQSVAGADEKLLKLAEIRTDIDAKIKQKAVEITRKGGKKALATYVGTVAAEGGLVVGATILTGGAALPLFLLFPGVLGAGQLAKKVGSSSKKRLEQGASDFIGQMETHRDAVLTVENRLLEDNMEAIARSSMRDYIFGRYPDLKGRFAEASARRLAEGVAGKNPVSKRKSIFDRFPGR